MRDKAVGIPFDNAAAPFDNAAARPREVLQ